MEHFDYKFELYAFVQIEEFFSIRKLRVNDDLKKN